MTFAPAQFTRVLEFQFASSGQTRRIVVEGFRPAIRAYRSIEAWRVAGACTDAEAAEACVRVARCIGEAEGRYE